MGLNVERDLGQVLEVAFLEDLLVICTLQVEANSIKLSWW